MKNRYYYTAGDIYCRIVMYFVCLISACCFLVGCRSRDVLLLDENGNILEEASKTAAEEAHDYEMTDNLSKEEVCDTDEAVTEYIMVYICGSVNSPGVYELEADSRIIDAVIAAGGMTEAADEYYVNQAQILQDGQRIYIPTASEAEEGRLSQNGEQGVENNESVSSDSAVNINSAGLNELMMLPGIGEVKAQSIIDYRNSNGDFKSVSDITKVPGIKAGMYEKIKDKITISF